MKKLSTDKKIEKYVKLNVKEGKIESKRKKEEKGKNCG